MKDLIREVEYELLTLVSKQVIVLNMLRNVKKDINATMGDLTVLLDERFELGVDIKRMEIAIDHLKQVKSL